MTTIAGAGAGSGIVNASVASFSEGLNALRRAAGWVLEDVAVVDARHLVPVSFVDHGSRTTGAGVPGQLTIFTDNTAHAPYQAKARGIPTRVLDACKRRGILEADHRRNAVFRCGNTANRTTGAEILGTRTSPKRKAFESMASGSRKARGAFSIPASIQRPNTFFFTESALDAVSAFALQQTPKDATVFASTDGGLDLGLARRAVGAGQTPGLPVAGFEEHEGRAAVGGRRSVLGARRDLRDQVDQIVEHLV